MFTTWIFVPFGDDVVLLFSFQMICHSPDYLDILISALDNRNFNMPRLKINYSKRSAKISSGKGTINSI